MLNALRRLRYFLRKALRLSSPRKDCAFWVNNQNDPKAILVASCPDWLYGRIPTRMNSTEEDYAVARSHPDPGWVHRFAMFSGYLPARIPF